jgi:hypothetical protein
MLPSLATMLNMRGKYGTAGLSLPDCEKAAQCSKSASVLTSIISCLGVHTHQALASPTLGLAMILTSQPAWEILKAIKFFIMSGRSAAL